MISNTATVTIMVTAEDPNNPPQYLRLYEHSNYGDSYGDVSYEIYGTNWMAQTFTPGATHTISRLRLRLKRIGTGLGNCTVSLQSTDPQSHQPTGTDLSGVAIDVACANISSNLFQWVDFNFSTPISVTAGTTYAIVVKAPSMYGANCINYNRVIARDFATGYGGGEALRSNSAGASWEPFTNYAIDMLFEVFSGEPEVNYGGTTSPRIVGYFHGSTFAHLGYDLSGVPVSRETNIRAIDYSRLTHLILVGTVAASAKNPTLNYYAGLNSDNIGWILEEAHAVGCKVMMMLYSGGSYSYFDDLVPDQTKRFALVNNVVTLLNTSYNGEYLDGIDLDWEGSQFSLSGADLLLQDLYAALHSSGKIISMAGFHNGPNISLATQDYLDFINLMCYGFDGPDDDPWHALLDDSILSLREWADNGFERTKLLMGIPLYASDDRTIPYPDAISTIAYYDDVMDQFGLLDTSINEVSGSSIYVRRTRLAYPIAGGLLWYGGLDLDQSKVALVHDYGYGGIMIYAIGEDYWSGEAKTLNIFNAVQAQWEFPE